MAITKEQVFAIADELDAAGQSPTLAAVRKALGSGSFTTISEFMSEWKASKASKARIAREAAPAAISERLAELGTEIWAVAMDLASSRLASERAAMAVTHGQLEAEKKQAVELADQLSAELERANANLAKAQADVQAAHSDAQAQQLQAASATARAVEIERRAADLSLAVERLSQQNAELVAALAAAARPAPQAMAAPGPASS